jgi:hypothetical protein
MQVKIKINLTVAQVKNSPNLIKKYYGKNLITSSLMLGKCVKAISPSCIFLCDRYSPRTGSVKTFISLLLRSMTQ